MSKVKVPVRKQYAEHTASDAAVVKLKKLRIAFDTLNDTIEECCPHSRTRSVALTKLEEAFIWTQHSAVQEDKASKRLPVELEVGDPDPADVDPGVSLETPQSGDE